jgi:hypothetical protein
MRIPVAVPLESRDGLVTKDATTKNAILEAKGEKLYFRKRPGLTDRGLIKAGTAQLLTYWNSDFVTIQGDHINVGITNDAVHLTTWNSADKASTVTLSNGDLTATITTVGSAGCVRSLIAVTSGVWYWEFTVSDFSDLSIGLANSSASLTATPGFSDNGLAYFRSGAIVKGNSTVATGAAFTNGNVISVFYDADLRTVKFYKGGTLQATLTGANVPTGDLYAIVGASGASSGAGTANFGATSFTHSVPGVSSQSLSPTTASLPFSAQDNGSNAFESLLMIKNSGQAWTLDTSGVLTAITDADYPGQYTVPLTSLTRSGTTATATTAFDTNFQVGSSVTIAGAAQSDYNGAKVITGITPSTATEYPPFRISISRSGTTATASALDGPHGLPAGTSSLIISGAGQEEYNGTKTVTWASNTTFTFTVTVTTAESIASPATGSPAISKNVGYGGGSTTISNSHSGVLSAFRYYMNSMDAIVSNGAYVHISSFDPLIRGIYQVSNVTSTSFDFTVSGYSASFTGWGQLEPLEAVITTLTSSGGVATATTSGVHGFSTGQIKHIRYAVPQGYNVSAAITVTSTTTFTYPLAVGDGTPTSPATGTIAAQRAADVAGASFTFTVANSPTTPATGTITAQGGRTTVPGIICIDGRFGVMDEQGVIYCSDEDAPESWQALEYFTAQNETGAGVAIAKHLNYGVAFKEWSTEFFYNAANGPPGSPWSPVENLHTLIGCAQGWSVADVGGNLLWIAREKKGAGPSIFIMQGTQQAKVSNPDIDRILAGDDLSEVHAYGVKLAGHWLYILTLEDTGITLVYNLDSKVWGEWSSYTVGNAVNVSSITRVETTATVNFAASHGLSDGDPVLIAGANQAGYNGIFQAFYVDSDTVTIEVAGSPVTPATGTITGKPYTESYFKFPKYATGEGVDAVLHESDGHLYELSPSVYLDDDVPVNVFARSIRLDGGSDDQKPMPRIGVVGDAVDSVCGVRWSDDDCATFSKYRKVDLSTAKPETRRCGVFRRRTIELRHIANTALQLEAIEL